MEPLLAPTLSTARLVLRPLADSDAPALMAIFGNPRVMRYWSTPPWTTVDQALRFIERSHHFAQQGDGVRVGITRREGGELIGQCTLFDWQRQNRRAEVGYSLAESAWGQGHATEAMGALLQWGFDTLDLHRVEADLDPRNTPSARLLERLGFVREGHLRERWIVDGEVSDSWLYGLLRREWRVG